MFAFSILIIIVALLVLILGIENPARVWAAKIEVEREQKPENPLKLQKDRGCPKAALFFLEEFWEKKCVQTK